MNKAFEIFRFISSELLGVAAGAWCGAALYHVVGAKYADWYAFPMLMSSIGLAGIVGFGVGFGFFKITGLTHSAEGKQI